VRATQGKVAVDQRNLILFGGRANDREGVCAGWAFKVFELVDGDRNSDGSAKHGGVAIRGHLGERGDYRKAEKKDRDGGDDSVH
jgi:hypothetical protein